MSCTTEHHPVHLLSGKTEDPHVRLPDSCFVVTVGVGVQAKKFETVVAGVCYFKKKEKERFTFGKIFTKRFSMISISMNLLRSSGQNSGRKTNTNEND